MDTSERTEQKAIETTQKEPDSSVIEEEAVYIEPDVDFIIALRKQGGDTLKKCMQCGTCSATCGLSPDTAPFPGKEMAWASWGMKERLLNDPDVWLCYHCNDCSTRCPRGAKPADVLAVVRQESVINNAFPRFFARWINQPQCIPLLLGIPTLLLTLALYFKDSLGEALGMSIPTGDGIIYSYSHVFPHWLLNSFFFFFSALALIVTIIGGVRFWKILDSSVAYRIDKSQPRSLLKSCLKVLGNIITHDDFSTCVASRSRFYSHMCVLFGFGALTFVTIWVITSSINPLAAGDFIYPFNFFSPWKILANIGGVSLLTGVFIMIWERGKENEQIGTGVYFDWAFLFALILVVVTGFATEILHYIRLEPHRHIAYFIHLVFVFTLLMYLPYSKFAHMIYRTIAKVYAEYSGRKVK
ncbi:MAG: quinone-interacting membrane-bound oxidoreductase complex subunit QmoC [candidate division Zixibacteria bacterium]|nr:quinone-interacting membrane-bound oxidoreductase complex subunit QmoC [candidate division Zixibacteria bacterium]